MILVTVGAQMPFDRFIVAVDAWVEERGLAEEVFAQIGQGAVEPRSMPWTDFLEPDEFRARLEAADALVAHAGTGSILNALELGKPVLVMPRHASKNETRNDHQIATAQRFEALGHVLVAWDEHELAPKLDELRARGGGTRISNDASPELIETLANFVSGTG